MKNSKDEFRNPSHEYRQVKEGHLRTYKPVEVVHGKTGVTGNFVETLTARHHLLHHVVVVVNRVICSHVARNIFLRHRPNTCSKVYVKGIYIVDKSHESCDMTSCLINN